MRRLLAVLATVGLIVAFPGVAAADHPAPQFSDDAPLASGVNSGGEGAEWELITSFPTGNPHTDLDFFTQGGEMFVSVGTLAAGPNGGGQSIFQLTEGGEVAPAFVSNHPSASCVSNPSAALGLQHDVEATPKGEALLNTAWDNADRSDAQLIIDATDQAGRCHDQGTLLGLTSAPRGGLEYVDITDITTPKEIALTSHIGESHTVNVDPKRPHIVYSVTSDAIGVVEDEDTGELRRNNENPEASDRFDLDGFEVVDISSCMDFPEGTTIEEKREQCRPEVYRYRYPTLDMSLGHTNQNTVYGCHELEVYPNDLLSCGSGAALIMLDMSGAFDDNGTPDDFTDDVPIGEPLPCSVRESTSSPGFTTGALITDCVVGENDADLTIPGWLELGAPSLEGVEWLGSAFHYGRDTGTTPAYGSEEDIDFNHETELTHSGDFVFASDERGGGVVPPGATCSPGIDNPNGNGGLHTYAVDQLQTDRPADNEEAWLAYARDPEGNKAIYRTTIQTQPHATVCTAHVFQQIPDQNRIFMGWYSQGTRVVDYIEHPDGSFEWVDVAYFIPENANQWVSHIFAYEETIEEDAALAGTDGRSFTYYGVAADFNLGETGRNAVDIYKVTLPAPPEPPTAPEIDIVRRLSGQNRVETAVAISQETHDAADTVVLARQDDYADALAGAPLAAQLGAPILLTNQDSLSEATAEEIQRLGASEAVILGGEAAVSSQVQAELLAMGVTSRRIGGENRFETAAMVASELGDAFDTAFVTEGEHEDASRGWPDALAAAPYAAFVEQPVLLVNKDRLPEETAQALSDLGVTETVVIGGTGAVSQEVVDELDEAGHGPRRVFGATRYDTARAVFEEAVGAGMSPDGLWLATGENFPDALAAGPAVAAAGHTLLLTQSDQLSPQPADVIERRRDTLTVVYLLGGEAAISAGVEQEIIALLNAGQEGQEAQTAGLSGGNTGLGLLALVLLPLAAILGRRRRLT